MNLLNITPCCSIHARKKKTFTNRSSAVVIVCLLTATNLLSGSSSTKPTLEEIVNIPQARPAASPTYFAKLAYPAKLISITKERPRLAEDEEIILLYKGSYRGYRHPDYYPDFDFDFKGWKQCRNNHKGLCGSFFAWDSDETEIDWAAQGFMVVATGGVWLALIGAGIAMEDDPYFKRKESDKFEVAFDPRKMVEAIKASGLREHANMIWTLDSHSERYIKYINEKFEDDLGIFQGKLFEFSNIKINDEQDYAESLQQLKQKVTSNYDSYITENTSRHNFVLAQKEIVENYLDQSSDAREYLYALKYFQSKYPNFEFHRIHQWYLDNTYFLSRDVVISRSHSYREQTNNSVFAFIRHLTAKKITETTVGFARENELLIKIGNYHYTVFNNSKYDLENMYKGNSPTGSQFYTKGSISYHKENYVPSELPTSYYPNSTSKVESGSILENAIVAAPIVLSGLSQYISKLCDKTSCNSNYDSKSDNQHNANTTVGNSTSDVSRTIKQKQNTNDQPGLAYFKALGTADNGKENHFDFKCASGRRYGYIYCKDNDQNCRLPLTVTSHSYSKNKSAKEIAQQLCE